MEAFFTQWYKNYSYTYRRRKIFMNVMEVQYLFENQFKKIKK